MKKKTLALLLCLIMLFSLLVPGTVAADDLTVDGEPVASDAETPETPETGDSGDDVENPDTENPDTENPVGADDSVRPDGCTCEYTNGQHTEGCALYAPAAPDFTELYDALMTAETAEAFDALYNALSEEDTAAFETWLDENGYREVFEEHWQTLHAAEAEPELPIVGFTDVGPLLDAPAANTPRPMRAPIQTQAQETEGLVLNKTATANNDGTYTITLEAYATGQVTTVVSSTPVDIVLVLDMSGSMEFPLTSSAVYSSSLDKSKIYYYSYKDYAGNTCVQAVTWNQQQNSWGYNDDYNWNSVTPKTNSNDDYYNYRQFYSTLRINALKTAVNGFISSVATTSPDSSIALVKFAGNSTTKIGDDTYDETSGYYTYTYNYSQIVMNLTQAGTGSGSLQTAVNALSPAGATQADYGMQHAKTIIDSVKDNGHKKVVIMFTDGEPTSKSSFDDSVANKAIAASKSIKDAGATVYTIGIFDGADATPVTDTERDGTTNWSRNYSKTNKYMHLVSSNYQQAESLTKGDTPTYPTGNKSYYLTPTDSADLNSIFTQISQEVGGASTTLDTTATIQDIVSPYFTMPANTTDITVSTAASIGNTDKWDTPQTLVGATITLDKETRAVSVNGFDFKNKWCGTQTDADGNTTFHNGEKLIISFTVQQESGFLGGNDVVTNGDTSGIYDSEGNAVKKFDVPQVNVPIKDVTVKAEDKNVYLKGEVTADQLRENAVVKVGNVQLNLDPTVKNYGLADWQTEYVNITVEIKDANNNVISDTSKLENLTDDTTYTITVKVSPKNTSPESKEGTVATEKSGSGDGKINVFKPELTFKDSEAYYGETVPTDFSSNLTSTEWKHGETKSTEVTMIDKEPTLTKEYTPDASKLDGTKYGKQDVPVKATVSIGTTDVTEHTTFVHQDCTGKTCTLPNDYHFWIHVKTCTLEIKKTGGDNNESYVFDVLKDGVKYSEVTIWGNRTETLVELPVGTYTIQENTGWSWRYPNPTYTASVTLDKNNTSGTITCTNKLEKPYWLNGFSSVVRNIFGQKQN